MANNRRIRRNTLILAALAAPALLVVTRSLYLTISLLAGTALVVLNLWVIEIIVNRYIRAGADKAAGGGMLILKLALLVLILYMVVRYEPVHLLAFMGGFFLFVMASLWEGFAGKTHTAADPEVTK